MLKKKLTIWSFVKSIILWFFIRKSLIGWHIMVVLSSDEYILPEEIISMVKIYLLVKNHKTLDIPSCVNLCKWAHLFVNGVSFERTNDTSIKQ